MSHLDQLLDDVDLFRGDLTWLQQEVLDKFLAQLTDAEVSRLELSNPDAITWGVCARRGVSVFRLEVDYHTGEIDCYGRDFDRHTAVDIHETGGLSDEVYAQLREFLVAFLSYSSEVAS